MTKFKKVLIGFWGVYVFAALSLAQAQGPDSPPEKAHFERRIQEIYDQLNLTDDQKKQLEATKQGHRATMKSSRQAMKDDKEALQQELMKPQLDMPKINALHDQIKVVQSQMEDDKLRSILDVRAILTTEQFIKFVNLMHKHKQEHEE